MAKRLRGHADLVDALACSKSGSVWRGFCWSNAGTMVRAQEMV
jgi:hypothetical protein